MASLAVSVRSLQSLTSSARIDVLRCLRARRMTSAEVALALGIRKSSAHKHLLKLAAAGFARRHDEDERLWVYYSLTREGRHLTESEKPYIALLFGASVVLALGSLYAVLVRFQKYRVALAEAWEIDYIGTPPPQPAFFTPAVVAILCFLALAAVGAAVAAWRLRRRRITDTTSSPWSTPDPTRR